MTRTGPVRRRPCSGGWPTMPKLTMSTWTRPQEQEADPAERGQAEDRVLVVVGRARPQRRDRRAQRYRRRGRSGCRTRRWRRPPRTTAGSWEPRTEGDPAHHRERDTGAVSHPSDRLSSTNSSTEASRGDEGCPTRSCPARRARWRTRSCRAVRVVAQSVKTLYAQLRPPPSWGQIAVVEAGAAVPRFGRREVRRRVGGPVVVQWPSKTPRFRYPKSHFQSRGVDVTAADFREVNRFPIIDRWVKYAIAHGTCAPVHRRRIPPFRPLSALFGPLSRAGPASQDVVRGPRLPEAREDPARRCPRCASSSRSVMASVARSDVIAVLVGGAGRGLHADAGWRHRSGRSG